MARLFVLAFCPVVLSACTHMPDWPLLAPLKVQALQTQTSQYSFDWRLSGNRHVAPLQVFDNGKQTWLQFQPGQAIPAIFQHTSAGDKPLIYQREGPYVVLPGVWSSLVLRGGQLQSRIDRLVNDAAVVNPASEDTAKDTDPATGASAPLPVQREHANSTVLVNPVAELTQASFSNVLAVQQEAAADQGISIPVLVPEPVSNHTVSPQDKNLRTALARWAQAAGWTFEPEHWAVDADIPIVGSASFDTQFKPAVQELVASTELADRPLQPCFYSNQVLRIVPYAQTCDRSAGMVTS